MLGKLLDKASYLKAKFKGDELELALNQATNDDNWQASTTVLHEISSSAYNHEKWKKIHDFLWEKLKGSRNWRKILKVLNIVDFILKNGPGFAINELRYEINFFATLASYQEIQNGSDRGASIRERAKEILGLLENEELLEDQRLRAKQIRQKMSHLSGTASWNSEEGHKPALNANKYESFNSKNIQKDEERGQAGGYYNYGSGNYGDREEDVKYNHDYFQNLNRFKNTEEKPKSNTSLPQSREKAKSFNLTSSVQTTTKIPQKTTKNQAVNKTKFDSLTQKLSKNTVKTQDGVIKPDLSYKKKDIEQNLIDTEAYFIQTRYNFHQENNQQPVEVPQIKKPETTSPQKTQVKKEAVDLLSEFEGLSFLGGSTTQQPSSQSKVTQNTSSIQNKIDIPIESKQNSLYPQPNNQNTNLTSLSNSIPQSHVPSQAPIINYSLTYNQIGPIQPTYNNPYTLGSHYPQYPYNVNAYQPNPNANPYAGYSTYSQQNFTQHNPHYAQYSGYPNPYQHHEPIMNQFSGAPQYLQPNTYANNTISMTTTKFGLQTSAKSQTTINKMPESSSNLATQKAKSNTQNVKILQQKVGWTLNNEKNLTDLSDLALEIGDSNKKKINQRPKQTNNQLKIDPWAW